MMSAPFRPTPEQLRAAYDKRVPDLIAPDLKVLFVGINPGLYSAAIGHHFGRPGNRFWPALYAAGFTDRLLSPFEEQELLERGYGITNVVPRATARADELSPNEFVKGGQALARKIQRYHPRAVAILGIGAYRSAFNKPLAKLGPQPESIGRSPLWILPNPSGLNAHYQSKELAAVFAELRREVEKQGKSGI